MLIVLFLAAATVWVAGIIRPPPARWQRALTWVAGIVMLAVLIAWGIEYAMQAQPA